MAICFWPDIQQVQASVYSSSPTSLSQTGQWTIVFAELMGSGGYVCLPTGASIGDVIEIHNNNANYNGSATVVNSAGTVLGTAPAFCRRVTSSGVWGVI